MSKTMVIGAAKTMFDKVRFHAAGQKLPFLAWGLSVCVFTILILKSQLVTSVCLG